MGLNRNLDSSNPSALNREEKQNTSSIVKVSVIIVFNNSFRFDNELFISLC